ncbi:hypothetical protein F3Y22_tig00116975pilonHSYRG00273 [Hibiscus syriacus]|uniref:Uncharacterized protein n=1 Tax=Hibiscus syriacus TaxID=106335 RepID=A0A6A2X7T0_HIBSY|nr:hypothetical protein F3Y22_tig00116975pilonHSYRG00273 [Hibiscus syriacus]
MVERKCFQGHAFWLSKLEFATMFYSLKGVNVLLPFAFYCPGMPSIDSLENEQFRNSSFFPRQEPNRKQQESEGDNVTPDTFKGKKSKATSKSSGHKFQWEIMASFRLSDDETAVSMADKEVVPPFPAKIVEGPLASRIQVQRTYYAQFRENSEKMSKYTRNFKTLRQAIEEFSSDTVRFSLADADANLEFETFNAWELTAVTFMTYKS